MPAGRRCRTRDTRRPQTGDGGGVSYAGLVFDLDGSQGGVGLLEEGVFLVVGRRAIDPPVLVVDRLPAVLAPRSHARRSSPRGVKLELFPLRAARAAPFCSRPGLWT